jgi:thymidine kinase
MNAGKSTVLLQSSFNYNERGIKTLLFTPKVDTRFEEGYISSRIGLKQKAVIFDTQFDFYKECAMIISEYGCVLIDEAQFLSKYQVKQLCTLVDEYNVPVLAYGLRSDFQGNPFEGSKYLLAWADELCEIKTICHCGRKATFNARFNSKGEMVEEGDQILIGDNDRYSSVCRKHYFRRHLFKSDPSFVNENAPVNINKN